jgi:glycosyltransferase involved in cell wall biosynthesis
MKILICHNYYKHRGGECQTVIREKRLLESRGHKVVLFTKDNKDIDHYNLIQKIVLSTGVVFSFDTYKKITKILKVEKPDIVHIHNVFPLISPSVYYAHKNLKVPFIQTVHNYRFLCPNGLFLDNNCKLCQRCENGAFVNAVLHKCYRNSYLQSLGMALTLYIHRNLKTFLNRIDFFISPSNFLKQKLVEGGIPTEKIVVKPHFIECEKMKPSYEYDNYAVYMGRLSPERGLFNLLEAWKKISGVTLRVIGDGIIRRGLEEYVVREKIPNVEFLGFVDGDSRFEILGKAMFSVLPCRCYENMPYAALESFACGVPIIASRIGGLGELVADGVTGFLFEVGNIEDLIQKVFQLINNKQLLLEMRYNTRRHAEEHFSEDTAYRSIMDIYNKTLCFS